MEKFRSLSRQKQLFTAFLLVFTLPVTVYLLLQGVKFIRHQTQATLGQVAIYFSPATQTLPPDKTVKLMMDADVNQVGFVRVDFSFDRNKVNLSGEMTTSPAFATVITKTSMAQANQTGTASIVIGLSPDQRNTPPTGTFELAQIPLKAFTMNANETASLTITTNTVQVVNLQSQNLTFTTQPLTLTLNPVSGTQPASLAFSPLALSLPPTQQLHITINPNGNQLGYAQVEFTFDPTKVRLTTEITPSPLMGTVIQKTSLSQANATGRAVIILGLTPDQRANPPTTQFTFASLSFTSATTAITDTTVQFTPAYQLVDLSQNILSVTLSGAAGLTLNKGATTAPTPPPTSTPIPTPTRTPTPTPTRTPTPAPTTPTSRFLNFKVRLQGITKNVGARQITISLKNPSGTFNLGSQSFVSDATGTFTSSGLTMPVTLQAGLYDIYFKSNTHLQKKFSAIQINNTATQNFDFSTALNQELLAADVNADNKLTLEDITTIINARGNSFSVPVTASNSNSDINADGFISIEDIALSVINWSDLTIGGDI